VLLPKIGYVCYYAGFTISKSHHINENAKHKLRKLFSRASALMQIYFAGATTAGALP
jgi:hypothetical protein